MSLPWTLSAGNRARISSSLRVVFDRWMAHRKLRRIEQKQQAVLAALDPRIREDLGLEMRCGTSVDSALIHLHPCVVATVKKLT